MASEIRTRFAPSPTGYLHIGGVRTALFNWLFARQHGGKFILRIDDTDQERNMEEALAPILHGFRWLGLDWDEGPEVGGPHEPYFQSRRAESYRTAAETLLEKGAAYRDYATTEEIQAERQAAQVRKEKFVYSRKWMAETDADRARFEGEGRKGVVRLKMPREGKCEFSDHIRGDVAFDWAGEQDHVIQRADGSCLYHLASVVDDHAMAITHVIRAEEHLSNTPRQIFIAQGLGYGLPEYAHLPYVAEPGSRNKLSKRKLDKYLKNADFARSTEHGRSIAAAIGLETSSETFNPVIVDFYEQVGYLPDAVINYLLLLGWALDDKTEFFTRPEMIEKFSLGRVNKAPASFDAAKLLAFQDRYMRALSADERRERVLPFLERTGVKVARELLDEVLSAAGDRIKVAGDILDFRNLFVPDEEITYDEKAFEKRLKKPDDAARLLRGFREKLAGASAFDAASLETLMRGYVEAEGVGLGRIIHSVRVAVSGRGEGFGLFDILVILGRDRCLGRIDRALARIASGS